MLYFSPYHKIALAIHKPSWTKTRHQKDAIYQKCDIASKAIHQDKTLTSDYPLASTQIIRFTYTTPTQTLAQSLLSRHPAKHVYRVMNQRKSLETITSIAPRQTWHHIGDKWLVSSIVSPSHMRCHWHGMPVHVFIQSKCLLKCWSINHVHGYVTAFP